jgi:hypothetical protein
MKIETTNRLKPEGRTCCSILPLLFLLLVCHSMLLAQPDAEHLGGETPESQFLELVDLVADPVKQLELLDTFLVQFPKYEGISTVYAQMQEACLALKQWDRALALGDKLLTIDESDIETVKRTLKAAEGKADAALTAKWRDRLKQLEPPEGAVTASSTVRLPFIDDEPAGDLGAVDLGNVPKQHKSRVEAILFNRALQESDLKRKLQLLSLFEKEFPASSHLNKVRYLFFLTHQERQDHTRALAVAEAILERDKSRSDVLFFAAQYYFTAKREPAKVLSYSASLLDIVSVKERPENLSEQDWEKQKSLIIQQAHWMIGATRMAQEQWAAADKELRATLAVSAPGSEFAAGVLTSLGWANYKLRNIPEALSFYKQCAAINSPLKAAAAQSIVSIKAEYDLK